MAMRVREWLLRLADSLRRDSLERELTDELRFHRSQLEQDAMAQGIDAVQAAADARRRLGSETRVVEASRDRWSITALEHLWQDTRHALRGLRRTPGFTATVVLTLALGLGANAAMFGIMDRLLLRPVNLLRNADQVSRIYLQWNVQRPATSGSMTYQRFLDVRNGTTSSFEEFAGYQDFELGVGLGDATRERRVGAVTPSFFRLFAASPVLGRFIMEEDDTPPFGGAVVVLTHDFWQAEFGGENVIGQPLQVGNVRATIIGIAPRGLVGLDDLRPPAVFIPSATLGSARGFSPEVVQSFYRYHPWNAVTPIVRRRPGISPEAATADVNRAVRASWDTERVSRQVGMFNDPLARPAAEARLEVVLAGLRRAAGPDRPAEVRAMFWVSGVAVIVLLIACANVMNLMLARALKRQREVAVRVALGVSRGRLLRQAAMEGIILALLSGAAGLLVAHWGSATMRTLLLGDEQYSSHASASLFDVRTIAVVLGLSIVVGIITGVAHLLLAERKDLAVSLRAGTRATGNERTRLRSGLLVLQGALSVALLVGATLFTRSLGAAQSVPKGYDLSKVLVVHPIFRGQATGDPRPTYRALASTVQGLPGVEHFSLVTGAPLWRTGRIQLHVPGIDSVSRLGEFTMNAVSADYFDLIGTRILAGRPITVADRAEATPVAVVSRGMARVLWPGEDAVGRCIRVLADTMPCTTVVGVAEDIVQSNPQLGSEQLYHYYLSADQIAPLGQRFLLVRVAGNPGLEAERLRVTLQGVMPGESYLAVRPMETLLESTYRTWRLGASMFVAFGVLALVVAAIGLYGVIGYSVTQRMHELGVRIALGARSTDVMRLVVGQSVRLTVLGIVLGACLALAAARWLQPLLFRQSATDPLVYGSVAAIMFLVAIAASAVPAARAARADPNQALRAD